MKCKKTRNVCIFIVASALFLLVFLLSAVFAETPIHEISNFEELVEAAKLSRQSGYQDDRFVLTNNIEITEENQNKLNNSDFKYISFGSSAYPFSGIFDGQGYYISNLKYQSSSISDTGLFSYTTTGSNIKNLTINNADIQADYRGGIVAGYADGTIFENITVTNSHLSILSSNNSSAAITDGGIRGGAIVGEANNCILYNCESKGTTIETNNTEGVAGLSGKGLYLGGLIGTSVSTEVEYSRVIDGSVNNQYNVAVGTFGGNTLYVGGIVGQMKNNSKVIDSFSTAELYFYTATYVSVGAGNSGHIGGITGAMFGDKNEIHRSHYAGKASSRQYNTILVIPIIQDNVNIAGITDVYEGGLVTNTYFKSSLNPDVDMNVLENKTSTSSYGPLTDERYIDKHYWQTQNYDFSENMTRQTSYNQNHINKWIMDNEKGIPVHGSSIAVTLDFPGAGSVTIGNTELVNTSVSTENPYSFAVQGIKPNEFNVNIMATVNEGYRLFSWYKVPNVIMWLIEENHSYFDEIFSQYTSISNEKELKDVWAENNDLFVAYYQARVLFYDITGNIIDKITGQSVTETSENDWYNYGAEIPSVIPNNKPVNENVKLLGWTSIRSNELGGGYSSIAAAELTRLKNNNEFYEPGEKITRTMDLYPVYVDALANINVVFEGNEQDTIDDVSKRDGVGYTTIKLNDTAEVELNVVGVNEDGTFPTGYKFLGWYNENNIKVSKDKRYVLKDIDLTLQHTYMARFEYKVDYYSTTKDEVISNIDNTPYASIWHKYQEIFQNLKDVPIDGEDTFCHWASDSNEKCSSSCKTQIATNHNVVSPLNVYAHVNGSSSYDLLVTSDFPNASSLSNSRPILSARFTTTVVPKEGYNFILWGFGAANGNQAASSESSWDRGTHVIGREYHYEAHLNANVTFYDKINTEPRTVTRHYNEQLFHSGITYSYQYPITGNTIENYTDFSEASPADSEMKIAGYTFLGWISSLDVEKDTAEWNYIYDVVDDLYCTSDISKVKPYILTGEEIVQATMNIYPVYAKWNVITKTNVDLGNIAIEINTPSNPQYVITESETEIGIGTVTITPDADTYIVGNSGKKYVLTSLVRVYQDGTEEIIQSSDNIYKYNIEAGPTYTFIAKYEQIILAYHLNDSEISISTKIRGESIETLPMPTYNIKDLSENYIFMGWTTSNPTDKGYYKLGAYSELENLNISLITNSTIVNKTMELWPVYIAMQIEVKSNIDTYLNNNNLDLQSVRSITRPDIINAQLNALAEVVGNYEFVGWYKNYESESSKGDLITNSTTFLLQDTECLENVIYTAVYKKAYKVNYYNTKGEIIYTVNVYENEDRSFVREVVDNDENQVTIPIDYKAYEEINKNLESNQLFQNWQWQQINGTITKWEDFYNKNIKQDMDLYPIVRELSVKDAEENEIDIIGTEEEPNIIFASDSEKIYVCLNMVYEQSKLTIHVEDIFYKANSEYYVESKNGIAVSLFKNNDITQEVIKSGNTDENGDLIVKLFGEVVITRKTTEENNTEDLFIFEILDKDNNVINEVLVSQGESKTVKIPYGNYTVIQKKDWAWRYIQGLSEKFSINNNTNNASIVYEEKRTITKWFDSMSYI